MTLSLPHVLIAAALVLTACGNGDGDDSSAPTAPATTTASPETSPAPTTSPADDSVRIAVVDTRGRVVLLDGDSGDDDRVLMDGVEVDDPPAGFEPTLRLRDLDSGDERALTGGDFYAIQDLAWTADGEQLAFTAGEIKTGRPRHRPRRHVTRGGSPGAAVLDRRAVRIDGRADGEGLLLIQDGGPAGGTLLRWDGSGQPRELADDVLVAAW